MVFKSCGYVFLHYFNIRHNVVSFSKSFQKNYMIALVYMKDRWQLHLLPRATCRRFSFAFAKKKGGGGEFNSRSQVPDEHLSAHSYKEVCNVSDLPWVDLS